MKIKNEFIKDLRPIACMGYNKGDRFKGNDVFLSSKYCIEIIDFCEDGYIVKKVHGYKKENNQIVICTEAQINFHFQLQTRLRLNFEI